MPDYYLPVTSLVMPASYLMASTLTLTSHNTLAHSIFVFVVRLPPAHVGHLMDTQNTGSAGGVGFPHPPIPAAGITLVFVLHIALDLAFTMLSWCIVWDYCLPPLNIKEFKLGGGPDFCTGTLFLNVTVSDLRISSMYTSTYCTSIKPRSGPCTSTTPRSGPTQRLSCTSTTTKPSRQTTRICPSLDIRLHAAVSIVIGGIWASTCLGLCLVLTAAVGHGHQLTSIPHTLLPHLQLIAKDLRSRHI